MKAKYLAFSCCFMVVSVLAQPMEPTANYELLHTLEGPFTAFTTDQLQNIYALTKENEVVKYTPDGSEQFRYPNKSLGAIGSIDASNPFHILLFFPEYQNVLVLDRTLNVTGQFNLFRLGLFQVAAVGMTNDNKLWLYDEVTFRLKKIAENGEVVLESNDLSLAIGKTIHPVQLIEKGQSVYLNDLKEGLLVFDVFGQYLKTLGIKGVKDFQVMDEELFYLKEGKLTAFHLKSLTERTLQLPANLKAVQKVRVEKERLYVLDQEGLKVFRY